MGSEVVLAITAPGPDEIALLADGATSSRCCHPPSAPDLVESLAQRGITAVALDAVPRISRAQSMDVLSSMANIAGYRAVVEAAHEFGRFFTGQVTAAGKVPPAKVLVAGAGVAGLAPSVPRRASVRSSVPPIRAPRSPTRSRRSAARISRRRRGRRLHRRLREGDECGLRPASSRDLHRAGRRRRHHHHDRAHPRAARRSPDHGIRCRADEARSVIVDMAAGQGGNVEGAVAGERVVTDNGVVILGYTDLASRLAAQALAALRHEPRQPRRAADPREGRPAGDRHRRPWCSARSPSCATARSPGRRPPCRSQRPRDEGCGGAGRGRAAEEDVHRAPRRPDRGRHRRAVRRERVRSGSAPAALHGARAVGRDRLLRDRQGAPRTAHPAHVGDQRHLRRHRGRARCCRSPRRCRSCRCSPRSPCCWRRSTSSEGSRSPDGCSRCSHSGDSAKGGRK